MSQDRVICQVDAGVAQVQLNRPQRHNALDAEQMRQILATGQSLRERKDIRVIVLFGEGPSFCSGLDFPSFQQPGQSLNTAFDVQADASANLAQQVALIWQQQHVPVIAALHGAVYGGGCQIALAADFRIAQADALMCVMEIDYGLIPDMGISQILPPLLAYDQALEITLSGRKIEAQEALAMGLITRIADDAKTASLQMAAAIAARSPDAVRASKQLLRQAYASKPELLAVESTLQQHIMRHANFAEAVAAKMGKRDADFGDSSF